MPLIRRSLKKSKYSVKAYKQCIALSIKSHYLQLYFFLSSWPCTPAHYIWNDLQELTFSLNAAGQWTQALKVFMYKRWKILDWPSQSLEHIVPLASGKTPLNKAEVKIAAVQTWKSICRENTCWYLKVINFSQTLTAKDLQQNITDFKL